MAHADAQLLFVGIFIMLSHNFHSSNVSVTTLSPSLSVRFQWNFPANFIFRLHFSDQANFPENIFTNVGRQR